MLPLGRPRVPVRALLISVAALCVPLLAQLGPTAPEPAESLLWLLTLVPALLLSYYRGWTGSLQALAAGMVLLVAVTVAAGLVGRAPDPVFTGVLVGAILALGFGIAWVTELLHGAREEAVRLAFTDPLTCLPNRRYADEILAREFAAAQRGRGLVVVVFDLDDFKRINDRHGHDRGDRVLEEVGAVLRRITRRMDVSSRYGGEEFLSVLSSTTSGGAVVFVERVLAAVSTLSRPGLELGMSAGIAAYSPHHETVRDLVAAADAALFAAKREGKATYRIAPPPASDAPPTYGREKRAPLPWSGEEA